MRKFRNKIVRAACACIVTLSAVTVHAAELQQPNDTDAVWKTQSIVFHYRSEGRHYNCRILAYKISMILRRLGARDTLALRGSACGGLAGRGRFEVLMEIPVEATADNVRDITRYDSVDQLIARVQDVQLPSSADIQRFPAVWESVSFRKLHLDAGDCALVQQLRRQVLPKMSVQVTKDIKGVDCSQGLTGIRGPRLTVLALVPASTSHGVSY